MATPENNAIVTQRIDFAPGLMILRVAPDGWELPEFTPGQFTVLGLDPSAPRCEQAEAESEPAKPGRLIRRAYSIASSSIEREYLEFYVILVRSGALTPRLFALQPGDRVWLSAKVTGLFTMAEIADDQNVIFIATGTGLAPYMSMLRSHLEAGGRRKFAALHGSNHSWDLGYRTGLFHMQRLAPNFVYLPIIADPAGEPVPWKGPVGFVQSLWTGGAIEHRWGFRPAPDNTHVFLCGNPNMIAEMTTILNREGFVEHSRKQPGQIHLERYW
jgi:ferredoxin--NADP+ reductase